MWRRRAISIPLVMLAAASFWCIAPILVLAAVTRDIAAWGHGSTVRVVAFILFYLACETIGIVASFAIWLLSGCGMRRDAFIDWNYRLEWWWGDLLFRGCRFIFANRVELESSYTFGQRPLILFVRHSSMADTVLAVHFISKPHRIRLRYVLKAELLWDPCLDIVGNRIPNYFVRRGTPDTQSELAGVSALMDGLTALDGVLIYPEGTRFSPAKRARMLDRLAKTGNEAEYNEAASFECVLPPRMGGTLALLERNPAADAVFLAHTGLEGAATLRQLLDGALTQRTIQVRIFAVPYEDIPTETDARRDWFITQWRKVDTFVKEHQSHDQP